MLICLSGENKKLTSLLSFRFEKSKYFLFVDDTNRQMEVVFNQTKDERAAYLVAEKKPDLVITGNISANSFDFLKASGIKIISGVFGLTVKKALEKYHYGEIREAKRIPGAGKGRTL